MTRSRQAAAVRWREAGGEAGGGWRAAGGGQWAVGSGRRAAGSGQQAVGGGRRVGGILYIVNSYFIYFYLYSIIYLFYNQLSSMM